MIDWAKPIEYRWQRDKWCPATVLFSARNDPACKLVVVYVDDSDYAKWVTDREDCVRNVPPKQITGTLQSGITHVFGPFATIDDAVNAITDHQYRFDCITICLLETVID